MKNIIFLILFLFSNLAFSQTVNLIQNGDFEKGKTFFTTTASVSNNTSGMLDGKQSLTVMNPTLNEMFLISKYATVPKAWANKSCQVSVDYRVSGTPISFEIQVEDSVSGVVATSVLDSASDQDEGTKSFFMPCWRDTQKRIKLKSLSSGTGIVHIDNLTYSPYNIKTGTLSTEVQTYVPATQGLGTITSSEVYWSRNGSYLEVNGKFTVGTTSAVEARIYFPPGLTSENFTQGIRRAGEGIRATTTSNDINVLVEPNVNYFTLDYQHDAGANGITKQTGANIFVSGNTFTFQARVKIQGWVALDSYVEQRCKSEIDCANSLTARVSSTGVITDQSPKAWLTSCTNANPSVCTLSSGVTLTLPIQCTGQTSSTTTTVTMPNTSGFFLDCKKTGDDAKTRQTVQGSFYKPYASAWLSANFTASATVPINFDSIEYTSASGLITPSATDWKFTAPESGVYSVSIYAQQSSGVTTQVLIYKNGASYKTITLVNSSIGILSVSNSIKLNANDYIDIRPAVSSSYIGGALNAISVGNISIMKVAD